MQDKIIKIKCKGYGYEKITSGCTWSKRVANLVLQQIQLEMQKIAGEYTWHIESRWVKNSNSKHGGKFVNFLIASYPGGQFTDGQGNTPRQALAQCHAAAAVLATYNIYLHKCTDAFCL